MILDDIQTMYPTMTQGNVSTFVIGGLNNAHNACCNIRQVQDSLSGNGKIVVLLTFSMNLFALVCRIFLANLEPALQCFNLLIDVHSWEACTFWFLFLQVYPCRGHYNQDLIGFFNTSLIASFKRELFLFKVLARNNQGVYIVCGTVVAI